MRPEVVDLPAAKRINGRAVRTSNTRERDPATAALPELWARFMALPREGAAIPSATSPIYSVYTEYESDLHGTYTVILGSEDLHEGLLPEFADPTVIVPAGRYLVFTSTGEMPAAVLTAWQQVWPYFSRPGAPERAYTTHFEYYDPVQPSTVRIHIAVRVE